MARVESDTRISLMKVKPSTVTLKKEKFLAELFAILNSKLNHVQNIRDSARAVPVRSHNYNELRH